MFYRRVGRNISGPFEAGFKPLRKVLGKINSKFRLVFLLMIQAIFEIESYVCQKLII